MEMKFAVISGNALAVHWARMWLQSHYPKIIPSVPGAVGQGLHGEITWEREGAKVPTEPWRGNGKENEGFSEDILREN